MPFGKRQQCLKSGGLRYFHQGTWRTSAKKLFHRQPLKLPLTFSAGFPKGHRDFRTERWHAWRFVWVEQTPRWLVGMADPCNQLAKKGILWLISGLMPSGSAVLLPAYTDAERSQNVAPADTATGEEALNPAGPCSLYEWYSMLFPTNFWFVTVS